MIKESPGRRIFNVVNIIILALLSLATFLPFLNVVGSSFANSYEILERPFMLFPHDPTLLSYQYIFSTQTLPQSLLVSVFVTIVGTFVNLVMTIITAYPLAHPNLVGRRILMNLILFTMLFSGGMIPSFILVKNLGLIDSLASLILPGAINVYNMIVVKNFFQQLPRELEEAAKIDGAHELYILGRIIIPLSMPVIATFTLFYAVGHWNSYFECLLYINDSNKWTVQILLRQMVMMASGIGSSEAMASESLILPEEAVKMATIVVSTLPILVVYPFLQKYFAKGVLLGSVKG
ncbi:MAG: carbohydrate ABC transporter permease [Candidatus Merdivicinus sp.]|jgi:putative aldouronate transport system permease protein